MKNPHTKFVDNFPAKLADFCNKFGTAVCAELCGVSPRAIQLWIQSEGNPNMATKVGALTILKAFKPAKNGN